jgi:MFS family permease
MGLFVGSINTQTGPGLASVSLTFAFGQLWWGLTQPLAGIAADRYGPGRVLVVGGFLGAWLGGRAFEAFGNYDRMWAADALLAVGAAPAREPRPQAPAPSAKPQTV